ncbi:MAG TPA: YciI family protein [Burkholderiaceae bacterium]|nr:YciI family protein [Burkholderiaceae bacterium]
MSYMLLILEPTGQRSTRNEAEGHAVYDRMLRFGDDLKRRGLLRATESLSGHAGATRVQVRGGEAQMRDGPFAEAKEMVGGFYLIDCKTHEEALAIASQCPAAEWATVEVRALAPCYEDGVRQG